MTLYGREHPIEVTEAEEDVAVSEEPTATCTICGCGLEDHYDTCYDCGLEQHMEDMADARRKYDE